MKDPYKVLGVTKEAALSEIKKQYRKLAKKYHPDANPNNEKAATIFREITEAYKILSSEKLKAAYDKKAESEEAKAEYNSHSKTTEGREQRQRSTSTNPNYSSNPYEEMQSAFEHFFKFDPNGTSHEYAQKKEKNPMNTDQLFEAFFKPGGKR